MEKFLRLLILAKTLAQAQILPGSFSQGGSFTPSASGGGSFTHQNPLFRQSLKTVASPISLKHVDGFYFTDHTIEGQHSKLC